MSTDARIAQERADTTRRRCRDDELLASASRERRTVNAPQTARRQRRCCASLRAAYIATDSGQSVVLYQRDNFTTNYNNIAHSGLTNLVVVRDIRCDLVRRHRLRLRKELAQVARGVCQRRHNSVCDSVTAACVIGHSVSPQSLPRSSRRRTHRARRVCACCQSRARDR